MAQEHDILLKAVERLGPSDTSLLIEIAQVIVSDVPRLPETLIEEIVTRVADDIAEQFRPKEDTWRNAVTTLGRELAIGVTTSSVVGLLPLLTHIVFYFDSDEDEALLWRKQRRAEALKTLFAKVPQNDVRRLQVLLFNPGFRKMIKDYIGKVVLYSNSHALVQLAEEIPLPPPGDLRPLRDALVDALLWRLESAIAEQVHLPRIT
jgi:hypothetical protein